MLLWLPRHLLNACSRRLGPEAPWERIDQCLLRYNLFTSSEEECVGTLGSHWAPFSEPLQLSASAWPLGHWTWCLCHFWLNKKQLPAPWGERQSGYLSIFGCLGSLSVSHQRAKFFLWVFIPTALSLVGNQYGHLFPTVEAQVTPRQISSQTLPLSAPYFKHKS